MSSETQTDVDDRAEATRRSITILAVVAVALIGGCLMILDVNRWRLGAPVFLLWIGWLSIILTVWYLWRAGMTAARDDDPMDEEEFWRPIGRRDELLLEKRSLLKALKEIEFDHQLGKMSDKDAGELSGVYRARAIEIIKALDELEGDGEVSVSDQIDREIRARLEVMEAQGKGAKNKKAAKGADGESPATPDEGNSGHPGETGEAPVRRDGSHAGGGPDNGGPDNGEHEDHGDALVPKAEVGS